MHNMKAIRGMHTTPQREFYTYLTQHQQERMKPILGALKKVCQEQLIKALMMYMEMGYLPVLRNLVIRSLAEYCIGKHGNKPIVEPRMGGDINFDANENHQND